MAISPDRQKTCRLLFLEKRIQGLQVVFRIISTGRSTRPIDKGHIIAIVTPVLVEDTVRLGLTAGVVSAFVIELTVQAAV
jgi:hypothetical protein